MMIVRKNLYRTTGYAAIAAFMMSTTVAPVAQAALVSTDRVTATATASAERDRVTAFLARDDVRAQLVTLGIAPDEAQARVAALSDAEVSRIAGRIDELPAGQGAVGAVVGAVLVIFIVLLVTDLLGLTKVFPFTRGPSNR
jgi:hypothetical protein